jgi:hypothetical protein
MSALILKILLSGLISLSFSVVEAQQPTTTAISADRTFRGIVAYSGVSAINSKTWFIMKDSTEWHLHPPLLYFDSLMNDGISYGVPENFLWLNSSSKQLQWNPPFIPTETSQLTNNSGFISDVISAIGYTPYDSDNPVGFITTTGARNAISLTTTGSGDATYNQSTGELNIPTPVFIADSVNFVSRSIDSTITYTPNALKQVTVSYVIRISCTATIGSASTGKVIFQWSTNGGSSWNDGGEVENSNTVTLAITLNSVTTQTGAITWTIPANALCRLKPTSTGTTTITWIRGQEKFNGY